MALDKSRYSLLGFTHMTLHLFLWAFVFISKTSTPN